MRVVRSRSHGHVGPTTGFERSETMCRFAARLAFERPPRKRQGSKRRSLNASHKRAPNRPAKARQIRDS